MTGLIERDLVIDKLKQGYFDTNLQQGKNDPCVIDAMIDWSIRQVKDVPIYNPWHTGTPTEEGNYLLRLRHANMKFDTATFRNGKFMSYHNHRHDPEDIIKWQKIEPYEEDA